MRSAGTLLICAVLTAAISSGPAQAAVTVKGSGTDVLSLLIEADPASGADVQVDTQDDFVVIVDPSGAVPEGQAPTPCEQGSSAQEVRCPTGGRPVAVELVGTPQADALDTSGFAGRQIKIIGLAGDDFIRGGTQTAGSGLDEYVLEGGPGDDDLRSEAVALSDPDPYPIVQLDGGPGSDDLRSNPNIEDYVTGYEAAAGETVQISVGQGSDDDGVGCAPPAPPQDCEGDTVHPDVDWVEGDGEQSNRLYADPTGNTRLTGGAADDSLIGGSGSNLLEGGGDRDLLDGRQGSDEVWYDTAGDFDGPGVTVVLDDDDNDGYPGEGDRVLNIEDVRGTSKADTLIGDGGANRLIGEEGHDALLGLGGDDFLRGDSGDDALDGGTARDDLYGATGNDVLEARDGQTDATISCDYRPPDNPQGVDTARVDAQDPDAELCENVTRGAQAPLTAPQLLSPGDQAIVSSNGTVPFRWTAVDGALYELQIGDVRVVTQTAQADVDLAEGTYDWKVTAIRGEERASSPPRRLRVTSPPAATDSSRKPDSVQLAPADFRLHPRKTNARGGAASATLDGLKAGFPGYPTISSGVKGEVSWRGIPAINVVRRVVNGVPVIGLLNIGRAGLPGDTGRNLEFKLDSLHFSDRPEEPLEGNQFRVQLVPAGAWPDLRNSVNEGTIATVNLPLAELGIAPTFLGRTYTSSSGAQARVQLIGTITLGVEANAVETSAWAGKQIALAGLSAGVLTPAQTTAAAASVATKLAAAADILRTRYYIALPLLSGGSLDAVVNKIVASVKDRIPREVRQAGALALRVTPSASSLFIAKDAASIAKAGWKKLKGFSFRAAGQGAAATAGPAQVRLDGAPTPTAGPLTPRAVRRLRRVALTPSASRRVLRAGALGRASRLRIAPLATSARTVTRGRTLSVLASQLGAKRALIALTGPQGRRFELVAGTRRGFGGATLTIPPNAPRGTWTVTVSALDTPLVRVAGAQVKVG